MKFSHVLLAALLFTQSYVSQAAVETVIAPKTSLTALKIIATTTDGHDVSKEADRLFVPASTMKLLTAVAATASLGKDFKFQTHIYSSSPIINGVIHGNIYVSFNGDPSLTRDDLRQLIAQLSNQGLRTVTGSVFLVGDQYEIQHAPGRVWDDLGICYAAPVSNFILDKNCVSAIFKPRLADNTGIVELTSQAPIIINSRAVFDKQGQRPLCSLSLARFENNRYRLDGCHKGNQALNLSIAVTDPVQYAIDNLSQIMAASSVTVRGNIKLSQSLPADALQIAQHQSAPLTKLLTTMLLKSDNLIADSLLKRVGHNVFGTNGTFANGSLAMTQILTHLGIDLSSANIVDGSGLSRYNLLSANHLAQVMALIVNDHNFAFLIDALPVAGSTGTLKYRRGYQQAPLKEHVMAKTGSMLGVYNVAGVIKQNNNIAYIFVILQNGVSPNKQSHQTMPYDAAVLKQLLK
ncbi:D-alanyl-D-alanine carboxypeptidase/D-alanyl-D-alanine endopeptidase [Shewanella youngdeokensis]|uniref:D-alanyl-D-alanine carboxypeptidase/D-alanyl-D-alanine-endopeptidase n=1 Tax=Shewanella youngdeokensis TaxID=2999068 RepID=A0ABZ0K4H1_9GAMM|nr:D-alanyl-D-alanine carboxypeptidase/D-alanyl-D-alanine-endopeptidase [Shewanella sp. DAU334]